MVLLAVAETSPSMRSPAVKSRLCSQVTNGWGPLTCGVPVSVSLSPLFEIWVCAVFAKIISPVPEVQKL